MTHMSEVKDLSGVEDPEAVELLQALIRNRCVNDGTGGSGHETVSAELIAGLVEGSGADVETFEPAPGRASVVGRIEGRDPSAPSLCYLGHTDVVPVNEDNWSHDPFGGELIDGMIWGRGAVDMLNLTAAMALAFARLARSGWAPKGTLVLAAVADEEALGSHGAGWLTEHAARAVQADYVITEWGGIPMHTPGGKLLPVPVGEKGSCWCRLRVTGEAGHASKPLRTDNALVTAAEVVRRLAAFRPPAEIHDTWRHMVEAMGMPTEIASALVDPVEIDGLLDVMPDLGLARQAHACTHMTIAPTILRSGTKINVIPDTADLEVDIRTLPGQTEADVRAMLKEAIGDLAAKVEIVDLHDDPSTSSDTGTPLWDTMSKLASRFHPDARVVPSLVAGATDARFFRRKGVQSYGFGMFSNNLPFELFTKMFHGDDERIDVQSLEWSAAMFEQLARDFLS
jgi:acetylornithine deacetylase/succinyl-diaminopimelate desuccinylase-like protein